MAGRSRLGLCVLCILMLAGLAVAGGCKKKKDDPFIPPQQTGDAPAADFTANVTSGVVSLNVRFSDRSTGDIDDWSWDFDGDGNPDSTDRNPQHEYTAPGWYTVSLTVTGPEGSDTCTKEMYILVANNIITAGSPLSDYLTIQDAIDAAGEYDLVEVANGTHKGPGNKDLDFGGKTIYLRSVGGASKCVIDCESSGRGFYFHSYENRDAVLDGFTIRNGSMTEDGGGIYCLNGGNPTIVNCIIKDNTTTSGGGGVGLRDSDPLLRDCVIENNHSSFNGGGFYLRSGAVPAIARCTIRNNTSSSSGGAIGINSGSPTVTDCVIQGNSAKSAGAINHYSGGTSRFIRCTITGNCATSGDAGAIRFDHVNLGTGEVTDCVITHNSASQEGGAIFLRDQARPPITNCIIAHNTAGENGGGICSSFFTRARLFTNCVIANNSAVNGGGIYITDQPDYDLQFNNCIIWGNTATGVGNEIYVTSNSLTVLNFCDYSNGAGDIGGSGTLAVHDSITVNPQFRNAGAGDYHLKTTSPCIDNGENSLVPGSVTTDLDGNDRIVNENVDLGPYEEQE